MDKLSKALGRLSTKERKQVKHILLQLTKQNFLGLNIKKLKGRTDIYRVRKGDLRIIYQVKNKEIFALAIERRSEKTYRGF